MNVGQTGMNSAQLFMTKLDGFINSGEGLIFIQTTETDRAVECINALTSGYDGVDENLLLWKINSGVTDVVKDVVVAEVKEPVLALGQFKSVDSPIGKSNYMIMNWLSNWTKEKHSLRQELSDCSSNLPFIQVGSGGRGKCVFVIVPPEWSPEQGLEDMPLLPLKRPDMEELEAVLVDILENSIGDPNDVPNYTQEDVMSIARNAMGMTERQAVSSFSSVIYANKKILPNIDSRDFARQVAEFKTQAIEKSNVLNVLESVPLDQIGGLDVLKEDMVILHSGMSEEGLSLNIDKPKGVLFVGPPGTGKSLSAKMISEILGTMVVQFDLSRVFGGLVGESEKNIKSALEIIDSIGTCVILIDEVDKVLSGSGGGDSGVSSRVLSSLLTHMQESDSGAFWVFTANRMENLPPELTRRGRIEEKYAILTPNSVERDAIFRIHLKKRDVVAPDDLHLAVDESNRYIPAELESAVVQAMRLKFHREGHVGISGEDIKEQIKIINPLSKTSKADFDAIEEWCLHNAKNASTRDDQLVDQGLLSIPQRRKRSNLNLN